MSHDRSTEPPELTRRGFVARACSAVLAMQAGAWATPRSGSRPNRFSIDTVHLEAAERAREIAGGRPIRLQLLLPDGCQANVLPVIERFRQLSGVEIAIEAVHVDEISEHTLIRTLSRRRPFDLTLPATFGVPDLAEAGALLPLESFARQYEPAEFQSQSLFPLGDYYRGVLYGYQTDGDSYLVFYNTSFLENEEERKRFEDEFGRPLEPAKTWEELDVLMKFFHRPDRNQFGGNLFRNPLYLVWEWWMRFHSKGHYPFAEDMTPQIDNEAGVKVLEEMVQASAYQHPDTPNQDLFANWKSFAEGNKLCNFGWGGTQKFLLKEGSGVRDRILVTLPPGRVVGKTLLRPGYFNWGWNYCVSSTTKHPEIAYLFVLFACSPEPSAVAVRARDGYFDPFRGNHYEDGEIQRVYSSQFLEVHRESALSCVPDLYLKGQGRYLDVLRRNLHRADQGRMNAAEGLKAASRSWQQITREMGAAAQAEQWRFLRSRYPEELRRHLS